MRNSTVRLVWLCLAVQIALVSAQGAAVRRLNLDMLVSRSEKVVHGRVVGTRSFWDAETKTIWTATELQVLECAKGPSARSVTVTEPGGVVGRVGHLFPGIPQFQLNEEVVVFLHTGPGRRLRVTGLQQGVYRVSRDPGTQQSIARPFEKQTEAVFEQGSRPVATERMPENHRLADFLQDIRQRVR